MMQGSTWWNYRRSWTGKTAGDHSTAGAKEAMARYGELIEKFFAYPIAGHHAGLAYFIGVGDDTCLEARPKIL
jgi:CRISPR-associated endonuclease/helicase Cas3